LFVTQKAIKGSTLADYLAQQPISDYQFMHPEFSDEEWIVWFGGASNALGHGIGAVLVLPNKQCLPFTARLCFDYTNNMAEYEACTLGIRVAIDFRVKLLKVYGD